MGADPLKLHLVGKIVAAHGLKGLVKIRSLTDFPERLTEPGPLWLQRDPDSPREIHLETGQFQPGKNLYLVRLSGIADRTEAEQWVGARLLISDEHRPELGEDEYYLPDLIGMAVIHQETGILLGYLRAIVPAGNDLLEVETAAGAIILIPFVKPIVPVVDLDTRRLEITPPEGLLETYIDWNPQPIRSDLLETETDP